MLILGAILVVLVGRPSVSGPTMSPFLRPTRRVASRLMPTRPSVGSKGLTKCGSCTDIASSVQGMQGATADEAVLWIKRNVDGADTMNRVIAYFDGNVVVSDGATAPQPGKPPTNGIECPTWLGQFYSSKDVTVGIADPGPEPTVKPALFRKALRRDGTDDSQVKQVQFNSLPGGLSTTTTAGSVGGMTNRGPVAVAQLPAPPVVVRLVDHRACVASRPSLAVKSPTTTRPPAIRTATRRSSNSARASW